MTYLSLFSGIGGLDLGLDRAGFRCVGQIEVDPFCRAVLAKHWPDVPRWDDVRSFDAATLREPVDLVAGGFPCQDISVAGKGEGIGGARSGLWREMYRIIGELAPRWVLVENVPALRNRGADRVLGMLALAGYACRPVVVGAGDVGAPHRRQRAWILGCLEHAAGERRAGGDASVRAGNRERLGTATTGPVPAVLAHAPRNGQHRQPAPERADGVRAGAAGDEGLADAQCERRRSRARESGDETVARVRRGESSPSDERKPGREGAAGLPAVANAAGCGPQDERELAAPRGQRDAAGRRQAWPWPARPGEAQHDWEAPRLVEFPLGGAVDGVPARLVRAANRHALRAYGNAVVWVIPYLIGKAILAAPRKAAAGAEVRP